MPFFTLQLDPAGGGPILQAVVSVSAPRAAALQQANEAIPQFQVIRALVDTGASHTCIDPSVLSALGLTPSGSTDCFTPTTGATPVPKDTYDVGFNIIAQVGIPHLGIETLSVMESSLSIQGIHALIGRDVLAHCHLTYDGRAKLFTLAF